MVKPHNPLTLRNASVNAQLHMLGEPQSVQRRNAQQLLLVDNIQKGEPPSVQLGNATTTTTGRQYRNG